MRPSDDTSPRSPDATASARRLAPRQAAVLIGCFIVLVAVGRMVGPQFSRAAESARSTDLTGPGAPQAAGIPQLIPFAAPSVQPLPTDPSLAPALAPGLATVPSRSLGQLSAARYTVTVDATAQGPRFTVRDADGVILAAQLTADELGSRYPALAPQTTITSSPLMLLPDQSEPR